MPGIELRLSAAVRTATIMNACDGSDQHFAEAEKAE